MQATFWVHEVEAFAEEKQWATFWGLSVKFFVNLF